MANNAGTYHPRITVTTHQNRELIIVLSVHLQIATDI